LPPFQGCVARIPSTEEELPSELLISDHEKILSDMTDGGAFFKVFLARQIFDDGNTLW